MPLLISVVAITLMEVLGAPEQRPTGPPSLLSRLHAGAHVVFPDGRTVSRWQPAPVVGKTVTGDLGTTGTLCVFQDINRARAAGDGWHVSVTPTRATNDEIAVKVDWKRTRHHGEHVFAPGGTVELTMRSGESVSLDTIVAGPVPAGGSCDAVRMVLQVEVWGPRANR